MPEYQIPRNAPDEVRDAFRRVWEAIDRINGTRNWDIKGRRLINTGDTADPKDYINVGELLDLLEVLQIVVPKDWRAQIVELRRKRLLGG